MVVAAEAVEEFGRRAQLWMDRLNGAPYGTVQTIRISKLIKQRPRRFVSGVATTMTQMSMSVIAGLLLFLELTLSVEGKVMKGAARLDSMITELYIAKFAFSSYAHGVITVTKHPNTSPRNY